MYPYILSALGGLGLFILGYINRKQIYRSFFGKKIAVLGDRSVGKTTLLTFLTTGTIPAKYIKKSFSEDVDGGELNLRDLNISLKETKDVTGDIKDYQVWKNCIKGCDYIFYLLRADEIVKNNTDIQKRIRRDLLFISDWIKEEKLVAPVLLIGTHSDLIRTDAAINDNDDLDEVLAQDRFCKDPFMNEALAYFGSKSRKLVLLGSLKNLDSTQRLVYNIFKSV